MNSKQMDRKLRELFRRKPSISQPGRLLAHLANELGVENDSTRRHSATLESLLTKYEEQGTIELERSGSVLNGYTVVKPLTAKKSPSSRPVAIVKTVDTTEMQPPVEAAEEASEPQQEEKKEEAVQVSAEPSLSREELLTLALKALQEESNEKGEVFISSTNEMIADKLGVSPHVAKDLNGILGRLGLRISPQGRNPGGVRPHWVSREVTEVTSEMLALARKSSGSQSATESASEGTAASDVETKLAEIITGLEVTIKEQNAKLAEYAASAAAADRLAEVVQELEAKIASYEVTMAEATKALDMKVDEREVLMRTCDALRNEARELRAQQLIKAAPSPAVASILERYGQ